MQWFHAVLFPGSYELNLRIYQKNTWPSIKLKEKPNFPYLRYALWVSRLVISFFSWGIEPARDFWIGWDEREDASILHQSWDKLQIGPPPWTVAVWSSNFAQDAAASESQDVEQKHYVRYQVLVATVQVIRAQLETKLTEIMYVLSMDNMKLTSWSSLIWIFGLSHSCTGFVGSLLLPLSNIFRCNIFRESRPTPTQHEYFAWYSDTMCHVLAKPSKTHSLSITRDEVSVFPMPFFYKTTMLKLQESTQDPASPSTPGRSPTNTRILSRRSNFGGFKYVAHVTWNTTPSFHYFIWYGLVWNDMILVWYDFGMMWYDMVNIL